MPSSSHCRLTDRASFVLMKLGDGFSSCPKAVLKKVTFQRQLTDGLEHLGLFLLQGLLAHLDIYLTHTANCSAIVLHTKYNIPPAIQSAMLYWQAVLCCLLGFKMYLPYPTAILPWPF